MMVESRALNGEQVRSDGIQSAANEQSIRRTADELF